MGVKDPALLLERLRQRTKEMVGVRANLVSKQQVIDRLRKQLSDTEDRHWAEMEKRGLALMDLYNFLSKAPDLKNPKLARYAKETIQKGLDYGRPDDPYLTEADINFDILIGKEANEDEMPALREDAPDGRG